MVKSRKGKELIKFLVIITGIVLINILVSGYFFRFDLTEDKRYSIQGATVELLENLEEPLYVEIYLAGDLDPSYKMLQESVIETLEEFKNYAGKNIDYEIVNIEELSDSSERAQLKKIMAQYGITKAATKLSEGEQSIKRIYPGAMLVYKSRQLPVSFLKDPVSYGDVNESMDEYQHVKEGMENLEYQFASAMKILTLERKKRVAFIQGHLELDMKHSYMAMRALSDYYEVGTINLSTIKKIDSIDAIIVAQPRKDYSKKDLYKIDQYIMKGGKALFFIDAVEVKRDTNSYIGLADTLDNLHSLFFNYGVRVNKDLIKDALCERLPFKQGEDQRIEKFYYYPKLNTFSEHPVVSNMKALLSREVGSMDTIAVKGVKKTPLVFSSDQSVRQGVPVPFDYNELYLADESKFNESHIPVAYLLEGTFPSYFNRRSLPNGYDRKGLKEKSVENKIFVCSDGDIIKNEINRFNGQPVPMGQNIMTGSMYSNKEFFKSVVNFMLDENGIVDLRAKVVTLRPLDEEKLENDKLFWQMVNMLFPVVAVVLFGITRSFLRKRKYTRF